MLWLFCIKTLTVFLVALGIFDLKLSLDIHLLKCVGVERPDTTENGKFDFVKKIKNRISRYL